MPTFDIAHVRKRPGMYFGGTGRTGVRHMVLDVVGNSFDVVLAGRAGRITVTVGRDTSITIDDDGPGMQVHDRVGPSIEEIFTSIRDTPTADGHRPHVHIAPGGLGLGPVSALCSEIDLEIRRDGGTYRQTFARGVATSDLVRTEAAEDATGTGTTVRMVPDPDIFEDPTVDLDALADKVQELALLTPGLVITLAVEGHDPIDFGPVDDLGPFFAHAFPDPDLPTPMLLSREGDDFGVDLALTWAPGGSEATVRSYGNFLRTVERGRHEDGIIEGLREVFGPDPMGALVRGLRAVVHVTLVDPEFAGPTRSELVSPEALEHVADTVGSQLPAALAAHPELEADLRSRAST